jgi:hypothetical protein
MSDVATGQEATGTETVAPVVTEATTTPATPAAPAQADTPAVESVTADQKGTLLGGEIKDVPVALQADWPEDWRQKLAGEDKKTLDRLSRMASPADLLKSYRSLEEKLSSGVLKPEALPDDATPEQVAEWRKQQGLPESHDKYLEEIPLPEGIVLGEADKPLALGFAEAALAANLTKEQYAGMVAKYYELNDAKIAEREEADSAFKREAKTALAQEWGPEFVPNMNAVKNLLAGMPPEAADNFLAGRLADGSIIGDNPHIIKWMANMALEINPMASLMPAGPGDQGKGNEDRIREIEALMKTDRAAYFRNDALQDEYRKRVEVRNKRSGAAA